MKVIPKKWLPTRWPLFQTITGYLACEVWNAPTWIYILVTSFFILLWLVCLARWSKEEDIGEDEKPTKSKGGFSRRLKDALTEQQKHK